MNIACLVFIAVAFILFLFLIVYGLNLAKRLMSRLNTFPYEIYECMGTGLFITIYTIAVILVTLSPLGLATYFLDNAMLNNGTLVIFLMVLLAVSGFCYGCTWIYGAERAGLHIIFFFASYLLTGLTYVMLGLLMFNRPYYSETVGTVLSIICFLIAAIGLIPCFDRSNSRAFTLEKKPLGDGYFVGTRPRVIRLSIYEWIFPLYYLLSGVFAVIAIFGISGL